MIGERRSLLIDWVEIATANFCTQKNLITHKRQKKINKMLQLTEFNKSKLLRNGIRESTASLNRVDLKKDRFKHRFLRHTKSNRVTEKIDWLFQLCCIVIFGKCQKRSTKWNRYGTYLTYWVIQKCYLLFYLNFFRRFFWYKHCVNMYRGKIWI